MTPALKNAVAVTPGGGITEEMIAGYVAMFTIPDKPVGAMRLVRTFAKHDLETNLLPPARRGADVFASACRSVETSGQRSNGDEHKLIVTVDPVLEDARTTVYQIGRRVVDHAQRVVDHEKAMRVTFDKAVEDEEQAMTFEPLDPAHYATLASLEDEIRAHYADNVAQVPGYKLRGVMRSYMRLMGATNLRGKAGGVYFVPARHKDVLEAIKAALTELHGDDADLYTIPLVNDEGARDMVRKHFTVDAIGQVDELMGRLRDALTADRQRPIRRDFLSNVVEKRREIAGLRNEYSALLQSELSELSSKVEDLDDQIAAVAEQAGTS